jgi:hypothetical protein
MEELPEDIEHQITDAFPADAVAVKQLLRDIESPRVLRCVLHLAGSSLDELRKFHTASRQDWRDVIWWAEYDHPQNPDEQLRDYSRPFGQAGY